MVIFGVPLAQTMQQQQATHPNCKIPIFLRNGFKYIIRQGMVISFTSHIYISLRPTGLDIEGLFRIAGPKSIIKELKETIDKGILSSSNS